MTVVTGHFTLTPEQTHFKEMLLQCPRLAGYWNFADRECDLQSLEKALPVLSHGEQIMARFFVGVWLGENKFEFDLIDAVRTLDEPHLQMILTWMNDPVFP